MTEIFEMLDKVTENIKEAMKSKEKEKLEALRYLKAMLIENKTAKKPLAEVDVAINLQKKLKDSLAMYPADSANHQKIVQEISFLSPYVPASLSEAEVLTIIQNIKTQWTQEKGAELKINAGEIMKRLSPQIKGKFDGKAANDLVQKALL